MFVKIQHYLCSLYMPGTASALVDGTYLPTAHISWFAGIVSKVHIYQENRSFEVGKIRWVTLDATGLYRTKANENKPQHVTEI